MKNLDLIAKRILVISLSISAVLLSVSLLIFSVRPANAQTSFSNSSRTDDGRRYDAISANNGSYFLIWNTQTGTYKSVNPFSTTTVNNDLSEKFW